MRRYSMGDSFWTICTKCNFRYEYHKMYQNRRLLCNNCCESFIAIDTGIEKPPDDIIACDESLHLPFEPGSVSGSSVLKVANTNITGLEADTSGTDNTTKRSFSEPSRIGRPSKRKWLNDLSTGRNLERSLNRNGNMRNSAAAVPIVDSRNLLVNIAQSEIRKKLEEVREAYAEVAALKKHITILPKREVTAGAASTVILPVSGSLQAGERRRASMRMAVPDSNFHDFDKYRSEECFKAKQIWAIYDEEDGMPRRYCLIRQVISVSPFKVAISYMNSKSDSEFGSVNWIDSGFTKSCGKFRTSNTDVVEDVNIFSHVLSRDKTKRGGCLEMYPRAGDIWAIYKNWSLDWNRETPPEVRHQYEMVEILDDYDEEDGVCTNGLIKVDGYKTVYGRNPDKSSICRVAKQEMLRFSHCVPSWPIRGMMPDLPEFCWDLDPAATQDGLVPPLPPTTTTAT